MPASASVGQIGPQSNQKPRYCQIGDWSLLDWGWTIERQMHEGFELVEFVVDEVD